MDIHWFPGHMAKTRREVKESLKLVDAVIEIRDARIVRSSSNPEIEEICKDKKRIILLNKADLADDNVTKLWIKTLQSPEVAVISVNSVKGEGLKTIKPTLDNLLKEKHEKLKNKGLINITTRVMVLGIPNVGKSSFINKMAKSNIAKTGDRPGVTKSKQWIKAIGGIELMDTPGILWPKFDDAITAENLAFTGAIKDEIIDIEELSLKLLTRLIELYPERILERYKIPQITGDALEMMDVIGKKRGAVMAGGRIDYNRIAVLLLDEFRGGKLGKISLERP